MQFDHLPVASQPFPHVLVDDWLDTAFYAELAGTFPDCPPASGPTGYTLFWGDPDYDRLVEENPAWKAFFQTFHSQRFVDYAIDQFADVFREEAVVDLSRRRYVPYAENRADKQRATLGPTGYAPDDLWVRVDIMQGRVGYTRGAHLDHRRRAITLLVYFGDASDNDMIGGELILHAANGDTTTLAPRHNRMIMFPCNNASFHSVAPIVSQSRLRNFVQVTVSSSVDLWPELPGYVPEGSAPRVGRLRALAGRLFG